MKFLFLFIPICFIASCSTPQKLICNTWKIDEVQFLDSLNTFTPSQKEMLTKALKTNLNFTFLPDSTYRVVSGGETHNSKWWMTTGKAEKILYTVTPEGKIAEGKIIELKKNFFRFESNTEVNQGFLFTCSPATTKK